MKKFFKGCLIILGLVVFNVIGVTILLFRQMDAPGTIKDLNSPLGELPVEFRIKSKLQKTPTLISELESNDIIYQSLIVKSGLDKSTYYDVVYEMDSDIHLESKLPIQVNFLDDMKNIKWINNDAIDIENDFKYYTSLEKGMRVKVYSKKNNQKRYLDLSDGDYFFEKHSKDKVGMVSDLVIFDRKNKLLYYGRYRYDAFQ